MRPSKNMLLHLKRSAGKGNDQGWADILNWWESALIRLQISLMINVGNAESWSKYLRWDQYQSIPPAGDKEQESNNYLAASPKEIEKNKYSFTNSLVIEAQLIGNLERCREKSL